MYGVITNFYIEIKAVKLNEFPIVNNKKRDSMWLLDSVICTSIGKAGKGNQTLKNCTVSSALFVHFDPGGFC